MGFINLFDLIAIGLILCFVYKMYKLKLKHYQK